MCGYRKGSGACVTFHAAATITHMPKTASAIPVGTQFSPDLIYLPAFLQALIAHSGDRDALVRAVWEPYVRVRPASKPPSPRQRKLPLEAAAQYGLLTRAAWEATDLTRHLARVPEPQVYDEFAQHILLNLGGLRVVEGAEQMRADGLDISGDTLARYLTNHGFPVTEHNTAINSIRMWLAKAGIFSSRGWDINPARKQALLGLSNETLVRLVGFTLEQQAFVQALCRIDPQGPYPAAEVRNLAEQIVGHTFARASLPNVILRPLKDAGLIDYETGGTSGGKTSRLWTTPTFRKEILEPFIQTTIKTLDPALTAYYQRRPEEIYEELRSRDTSVKGMALEAYAVHIMRLMGFRLVAWRKRGRETGGAEVDVIMAGTVGGLPTRWQIQCKNTPGGRVDLEDVAKEVGLLPLTNATHIMLIANTRFTDDAKNFAAAIMHHSPITIFLLDRDDFARIQQAPGDLPLILQEKSSALSGPDIPLPGLTS